MENSNAPKRFYLKWPWNVLVYVLLALVLNILSIPVILALNAWNKKQQPDGPEEGYCLQRTRRRLSCLLWALLLLFLAVVFLGVFFYQLPMEKSDWDTSDTVIFYISAPVGLLFAAACVYMAYIGIRDAFFPEKSALAKSIRAQLPRPEEAPPVKELFAMVDQDIQKNGIWFDRIAVGREWVFGDEVSLLSRIRAIFDRDEIVSRGSGKNRHHTRVIELYILDDRKHAQISTLRHPKELSMLIDCLKLRAPDALFLPYRQYHSYLSMSDDEWGEVEREYCERKTRREIQTARTAQTHENQSMTLSTTFAGVTSRVTADLIRQTLQDAVELAQYQDEAFFDLTPSRPFERDGVRYSLMQCAVFGSQLDENREPVEGLWIYLVLVPVPGPDGKPVRNSMELSCTQEQAEHILLDWLQEEVPDLRNWAEIDLSGMQVQYTKRQDSAQSYPPKLLLVSASGAAQSHQRFTREDVEVGAEGIMDGSYRQVDLTLPGGYLWIRVIAGDRTDDRCTVTATRADADKLRFFTTKCAARQAASWLVDYYDGSFRPGGSDWKDTTRKMTK